MTYQNWMQQETKGIKQKQQMQDCQQQHKLTKTEEIKQKKKCPTMLVRFHKFKETSASAERKEMLIKSFTRSPKKSQKSSSSFLSSYLKNVSFNAKQEQYSFETPKLPNQSLKPMNIQDVLKMVRELMKDFRELMKTIDLEIERTVDNVMRKAKKQMQLFMEKHTKSLNDIFKGFKIEKTATLQSETVQVQNEEEINDDKNNKEKAQGKVLPLTNLIKLKSKTRQSIYDVPVRKLKREEENQIRKQMLDRSEISFKSQSSILKGLYKNDRSASKQIEKFQVKLKSLKNILQN